MRSRYGQAVPDRAAGSQPPGGPTGYLDRDTLIAVWPELHLPKGAAGLGRAPPAAARRVTWDGLIPLSDLHRDDPEAEHDLTGPQRLLAVNHHARITVTGRPAYRN